MTSPDYDAPKEFIKSMRRSDQDEPVERISDKTRPTGTPPVEDIRQSIYDILYEKSRVDGVRVLYEDEWPIEELATLIATLQKELKVLIE